MAQADLDALVSPAGNIPAYVLGAPMEPPLAGRTNSVWGLLGQHGIPTLSVPAGFTTRVFDRVREDRKSTRLNSSHLGISYAVFCLKTKRSGCARATRSNSCRGTRRSPANSSRR